MMDNQNNGIKVNKKTVIINSISSALALILKLSVLVWLQQYLLKRISAEEYSLIPIMMALMAYAPLLTRVLTSGLGRFTTIAYAKNDEDEVTRIVSTMFPILLLSSIIVLLLGSLLSYNIDKVIEVPPSLVLDARIMMFLLIILTSIQLPTSVFSSGFLIKQKLVWQDIIEISSELFRVSILFFCIYKFGPRALWVIVSMVCGETLRIFLITPISMYLIPSLRVKRKYFNFSLAKEITGYGGWGFLSQISETIKNTMDPLILNRFSTASNVAMFHVAGLIPRQLKQLLFPITRPFFPILSAFYAKGEHDRLCNTFLRTARYHSWVLLFFSVPAMIFNNELMDLYLNGLYDGVGAVMVILLSVFVLQSFNALGFAIVSTVGAMKENSLRVLLLQGFNLLLTLFFVIVCKYGAFGSAIATLISTVFIEITLIWPFYRKISYVSFSKWLKNTLYASIMPAVPSIIFCFTIRYFVTIDSWFLLFSFSGISALLYVICILFFGLTVQDKVDIASLSERTHGATRRILLFFAK